MLQTNWNVSLAPDVRPVCLTVSHFSPSFSCSFCHIFLFLFTLRAPSSFFLPLTFVCSFRFIGRLFFSAAFVRFFFSRFLNKRTIFKFYATPNTYYFLISLSVDNGIHLLFHFSCCYMCIARDKASHRIRVSGYCDRFNDCVNNGFNAKMLSLCLVKSSRRDDSSHYDSEKNRWHTQTYRSNARPANAISLQTCAQQQSIFCVTEPKCCR